MDNRKLNLSKLRPLAIGTKVKVTKALYGQPKETIGKKGIITGTFEIEPGSKLFGYTIKLLDSKQETCLRKMGLKDYDWSFAPHEITPVDKTTKKELFEHYKEIFITKPRKGSTVKVKRLLSCQPERVRGRIGKVTEIHHEGKHEEHYKVTFYETYAEGFGKIADYWFFNNREIEILEY